jgi:hypothetical protein
MSKEIEDEIGVMIEQLDGQADTAPKPPVEEPKPEPVVVNEEVPEVKEEVKEVVPEPAPEPPAAIAPDPKDEKIAALEARLAALEKPVVPEPVKPSEPSIPDQAFIPDDSDLDELTRDPKKLNEVLNKVYQKGKQDTRTDIMAELPNLISGQVSIIQQVKETTEKFYKENNDLDSFKNVVSVVYEDLAKANPNQTFKDLMVATAAETRKRLKLPAPKVVEAKKENDPPPPLPKAGKRPGTINEVPKPQAIDSEIEAMDKAVNS